MVLKGILKGIINWYRKNKLIIFSNSVGRGTQICKGAYLTHSKIGNYCYLGMYSYFNCVQMGNYCSIAGNVTIGAMEHDYHDVSTSTFLSDSGYDDRITHIGNDVWIGAQCVIRQGITIGDGSVIGANSFVNKDVPPYSIVFGTPARIYKMRFDNDQIQSLLESKFWEYNPSQARKIIMDIKNGQRR